jgi:hypothetical protein
MRPISPLIDFQLVAMINNGTLGRSGAMLFHVSEEFGIQRFDPRPSQYADEPVVWAIDADRLCNYLLPRDCPRVTYYAGSETTAADVERFLGSSLAVIAIESAWLERLRSSRLYCYDLPSETFECVDECAGYFVSRRPVVPSQVQVVDDLFAALVGLGVELRFVPNLWSLRDAVVSSTLRFSLIRMRNALPRQSPEPFPEILAATKVLRRPDSGNRLPLDATRRMRHRLRADGRRRSAADRLSVHSSRYATDRNRIGLLSARQTNRPMVKTCRPLEAG